MYHIRFLLKHEYIRTLKLFCECFPGNDNYIRELYGELDGNNCCNGTISDHRIAVLENEAGEILSMVHYKLVKAVYSDKMINSAYIMDVATRKDFRRQGFMDSLIEYTCAALKAKKLGWCFLVAVNRDIYRHLGFIHDWIFNPQEASLLDADEGLTVCSARLLNADSFAPPDRLEKMP